MERKALGRHTHVIKDKNNSKFIQNNHHSIPVLIAQICVAIVAC
jgi:hypothetical protein